MLTCVVDFDADIDYLFFVEYVYVSLVSYSYSYYCYLVYTVIIHIYTLIIPKKNRFSAFYKLLIYRDECSRPSSCDL